MDEAKIKEVAVIPYQQKAYCECGEELKYKGGQKMCNPPLYIHRCEKCNKAKNLDKVYPCLVWKEKKK